MAELARGNVGDRPWGRTLAALGLRGVSGQLALVADGKRFVVAFEHGAVVAATSPLTSDAAVRVALTGHLVSSSQVPEISRRQSLAPNRDEIDVIAELARLGPDHALRLRRRVIAQRAARTFSISQGQFVVTDQAELPVLEGCALDIRAVIYMGARANLSEHRLAHELDQLGSWFRLKPVMDDDLPQFGFSDAEQPIIERLRDGGTIEDIEEFAASFIDSRTVRAVVYALASYNACDHGPPRPKRPEEESMAMTREVPRMSPSVSGTAATQPISMAEIPLRPGSQPVAPRASTAGARAATDMSELTPISIARLTPVSEATPTSIARLRPPSEATPISMPRPGRPTPAPGRPATSPTGVRIPSKPATEPGIPRTRPATEGTPISMPRAGRPTPSPTPPPSPSSAIPRPMPQIATRPMPGATRPPTTPGRSPDEPREPGTFDAPTQRDAAYGSDPGLRPPELPSPRESSSPGLRPPELSRSSGSIRLPADAREPSNPGLRPPEARAERVESRSGNIRIPTNPGQRAESGSIRVPPAVPRGTDAGAGVVGVPRGTDAGVRRGGAPRARSSTGVRSAGIDDGDLALPQSGEPEVRRVGSSASAGDPVILRVPSARPAAARRRVVGTDSPQSHEVKATIAQRLKLLEQGADHYQLLGIAQDAATEVIRKAYFALARQLHPDRLAALGISDDGRHAQRLFAQINAGFSVLSDPSRREHYLSVLRRGGEAQIRADEVRAEELARRVLDAEEAFRRGELALRRDQPAAAVSELTLAVQLNPDEADYHALLAWSQFCAAPDKAAIAQATRAQLDQAIQRSPHAVTGRFFLGRVERMLGRDQDAARLFREVLASAPGHTEAAAELRVLEARLGDKPGGGGGLFGRKR